jgi:hypothetical protein
VGRETPDPIYARPQEIRGGEAVLSRIPRARRLPPSPRRSQSHIPCQQLIHLRTTTVLPLPHAALAGLIFPIAMSYLVKPDKTIFMGDETEAVSWHGTIRQGDLRIRPRACLSHRPLQKPTRDAVNLANLPRQVETDNVSLHPPLNADHAGTGKPLGDGPANPVGLVMSIGTMVPFGVGPPTIARGLYGVCLVDDRSMSPPCKSLIQ